jgi:hypothetical protein
LWHFLYCHNDSAGPSERVVRKPGAILSSFANQRNL